MSVTLRGMNSLTFGGWEPTPAVLAHNWRLSLRWGEAAAEENRPSQRQGTPVEEWETMWSLFCRALEVSRLSDSAPPRPGYPSQSAWPDAPDEVTHFAMEMAYIRGEIDEKPENDNTPARPSAREVDRRDAVLDVWHGVALKGRHDWRREREAVRMLAEGCPPRKVRALTGIPKSTLHDLKRQAMGDMARVVRRLAR